jgi:hypothetical protein
MSSIGNLPAELLIDIFEKCSWSTPLAPLTLSFVCHMWHDIVYTSPRVWQLISLQDVRDHKVVAIEKLQRQARIWLANSSPLPFDVTVDFQSHSQEQFLAIISILIGGLDRWTSCTFVRGKHKEMVDISGIVLAARRIRTTRIRIQVTRTAGARNTGNAQLYGGRQWWITWR